MENRYHKVVDLGPVLNWSKKNCGRPGFGPKLIHIGKKKKKFVLIIEIKTQEYYENLHLLLIFFDKYSPHLGVRENNHHFVDKPRTYYSRT